MLTEGYNEIDCVRVTHPIMGEDPFTRMPVPVPVGQIGTVIVGSPGRSTYHIEFMLQDENDDYYSVVAIVNTADLEPYTETATV